MFGLFSYSALNFAWSFVILCLQSSAGMGYLQVIVFFFALLELLGSL